MAQKLRAAGQEIALLALFDSDCPWHVYPWRRRKQIILREIRNSPKLLQRDPATQRRLLEEKADLYLVRKNTASPVVNPNRGAARRYRPVPYPGKIDYFWASDRPEASSDTRLGWRELAERSIEIHRIPGDHETILREPHLEVLADRLRACLDNALPKQ